MINYKILIILVLLQSHTLSAAPAEFDCVIEPHEVVAISSPVPGILKNISVERSDLVREGQILAELHSDIEKATLQLAKAKASFNGEIESQKANLDYASRKLKRTQQLFDKKAIPDNLKDEAVAEAQIAKMALHQAREKKQIAQLELKRAEQILEQRTIKSPISGIIIDRVISAGVYVKSEPILQVAKVDPLRVETYVPTALFEKIKTGMRAEIIPEAPMNDSFPAVVTIVDKVVDAASGTFSIRLELPNKENKIPAGLKCKVRFIVGKKEIATAK
ncbi:MAG: efflux RND transporter periplasmic adaptor subunit [Gammaproteobacteria bacterium]